MLDVGDVSNLPRRVDIDLFDGRVSAKQDIDIFFFDNLR
jgi:hypothetical protein